jgi:Spy/CpxP family protein refolding chaperone
VRTQESPPPDRTVTLEKTEEIRSVPAQVPPPEFDHMLFLFARELDLTAKQEHTIEDVLRDRQKEIERVQDGVRRSHRFRRGEYVQRIEDLKAISYAQMGQCLSPAQHRRFQELLAEGRLGDAIAFTLPEGTIIEE